eukprot:Sdes_comp20643_c0_seq1m15851
MIAELMKQGELVPQEVTLGLLKDAIKKSNNSVGYLVDGFPRAVEQGQEFEKNICPCQFVLFFECSESTMESRLLKRAETSGREDDNIETIKKRFKTFMEKSLPVIDFYGPRVRKISAESEPNVVFQQVENVFNEFHFSPIPSSASPSVAAAAEVDAAVAATNEPAHANDAAAVDTLAAKSQADLSEARIVFVLGGPGSGKGTQCDKIVKTFGLAHFSAGDLLRDEVNKGTERGKMIDGMMKEGQLVPQEITIQLLRDAISSCDYKKGVLVDGFPRACDQGQQFEASICPAKVILFFECSEQVMTERLMERAKTSGRADDNMDTIKKRFHTFVEKSLPVIEMYASKTEKISAIPPPDEVFLQVKS